MATKRGFVSIVGPTNSGKSTLVNALVGEKVSIVSNRPQTTYHGIKGILTKDDVQIVFIDTPGLQNYRASVAQLLNRVSERSLAEADLFVWVFDCSEASFKQKFEKLKPKIAERNKEKSILVLNKIDRVPKPELLPLLEWLHKLELFDAVIPLSALKKNGLVNLIQEITLRLPEGPFLFPSEIKTDRSKQFTVTEWIREQAYHHLYAELPYSLWVELESWEEGESSILAYANIHVDSKSKKGMVIGQGGKKLKEIGMAARLSLEKKMGKKLSLFIHVDTQLDWQRDRAKLHSYLEL